jgi:GNAT superfamily N-acetyltransferase
MICRHAEMQVTGANRGGIKYRVREVDGTDDDVADTLAELHQFTFLDAAPVPTFDQGHWWIAFKRTEPVAFAGIVPSTFIVRAGYFCRVGVLGKHCGHGLQSRLMRAMEARARLNGWRSVISDTTDNMHSANNFIRAGYRLFRPENPWAWPNTLYWRKDLS